MTAKDEIIITKDEDEIIITITKDHLNGSKSYVGPDDLSSGKGKILRVEKGLGTVKTGPILVDIIYIGAGSNLEVDGSIETLEIQAKGCSVSAKNMAVGNINIYGEVTIENLLYVGGYIKNCKKVCARDIYVGASIETKGDILADYMSCQRCAIKGNVTVKHINCSSWIEAESINCEDVSTNGEVFVDYKFKDLLRKMNTREYWRE